MNKSFLQTDEWLQFQNNIGHKTWRFDDGKIRANIIQHKISFSKFRTNPFGKNYLYIPHGPEIFFDNISGGLKNEVDNFLRYLKNLAKENKSIFVRKGMKRSKKEIQPSTSVILNLGLSEEELLERMHHKTRYNIKVAERNQVTAKDFKDLDAFWKLLKNTAKRDRFSSHNKEYYQKLLSLNGNELKVDLVLAYHGDKPVAGAIILCYGDTGYYLHGASDYNYRQLMAPYALHWENIKYLKQQGFKYYDFWGIDAKKWPGVTRFKLGWGGETKEYPGSFDLVVSKFWYLMYNLARRIF